MFGSSQTRVVGAVLVAGATFKLGGHALDAANSTEGSDVSAGWNAAGGGGSAGDNIKVCDKESDGHQVHNDVDLVNGVQYRPFMTDSDGNNDSCPSNSSNVGRIFAIHRVVEEIPVLPDQFGAWANGG